DITFKGRDKKYLHVRRKHSGNEVAERDAKFICSERNAQSSAYQACCSVCTDQKIRLNFGFPPGKSPFAAFQPDLCDSICDNLNPALSGLVQKLLPKFLAGHN